MMQARMALGLAALLVAAPMLDSSGFLAARSEWPQFRGPQRDGVSRETGLLKQWPTDGPRLLWKTPNLGIGFSSIAIAGGRIFTMGDRRDACYLCGLAEDTGRELWSVRVGRNGGNYAGPRCTPTVDGNLVFALGQHGDLLCVEAATGKERWRKNLPKDFGGQCGGWNYTESPLVDAEKLVCTPGGGQATMLALDKNTGRTLWKCAVPDGDTAGYSSIVVAEVGVRQYVQLTAEGLIGVQARDGKLLWTYGDSRDRYAGNTANVPTPIVLDDHVFSSAGYGRGGGLIKLTANGQHIQVNEIYFKPELTNKHGGLIQLGDHVYGDRDDSGSPFCVEAKTGKIAWRKNTRTKGEGSASIVAADGHLYIRYSNGYVALVEASPAGYKEKGVFKIPNSDSNSWNHPVICGGRLYLREKDTLWCYDVKGG